MRIETIFLSMALIHLKQVCYSANMKVKLTLCIFKTIISYRVI